VWCPKGHVAKIFILLEGKDFNPLCPGDSVTDLRKEDDRVTQNHQASRVHYIITTKTKKCLPSSKSAYFLSLSELSEP
jgi:hypothetical protein